MFHEYPNGILILGMKTSTSYKNKNYVTIGMVVELNGFCLEIEISIQILPLPSCAAFRKALYISKD